MRRNIEEAPRPIRPQRRQSPVSPATSAVAPRDRRSCGARVALHPRLCRRLARCIAIVISARAPADAVAARVTQLSRGFVAAPASALARQHRWSRKRTPSYRRLAPPCRVACYCGRPTPSSRRAHRRATARTPVANVVPAVVARHRHQHLALYADSMRPLSLHDLSVAGIALCILHPAL